MNLKSNCLLILFNLDLDDLFGTKSGLNNNMAGGKTSPNNNNRSGSPNSMMGAGVPR